MIISLSGPTEDKTRSQGMLFELFNEELFGSLPEYLTKVMAQGPATMVLRESMRQATKTVLEQNGDLKKRVSEAKTLKETFNICYELYGDLGFTFQYDVEFEDDKRIILKVTECPHLEYTLKNQAACSVCEGIILGILEEEFGISLPKIEYEKCMARGDDYCRYEINVKETVSS